MDFANVEAIDCAIDTAVLLVAGVGSRLRPLTDNLPKALVKVGKLSLLEHAVARLREQGVRRFVFATGYQQQAVRDAVAALGIDARFCHNPRFAETQNSVSLAYCRSELESKGFYKLDGDVIFERGVLERLDQARGTLGVAVDGKRVLDAEAMKVVVNVERKILQFGKPIPVEAASGESIGIERIPASAARTLFDALDSLVQQGILGLYYEDVYSDLIRQGRVSAHGVEVGDLVWTEIDDYLDLARAVTLFGNTEVDHDAPRI